MKNSLEESHVMECVYLTNYMIQGLAVQAGHW